VLRMRIRKFRRLIPPSSNVRSAIVKVVVCTANASQVPKISHARTVGLAVLSKDKDVLGFTISVPDDVPPVETHQNSGYMEH
jgi:hypothetical protein